MLCSTLLCHAVRFTVGDRGTACTGGEGFGKRGGIVKANLCGNLGNRIVGKEQALFCVVQTCGLNIPTEGQGGLGFEDAAEVEFGNVHGGGECIQREIREQIPVDVGNSARGNAVVGDELLGFARKAVIQQKQKLREDLQFGGAAFLHLREAVKSRGKRVRIDEREVQGERQRHSARQLRKERAVKQQFVTHIIGRDIGGGAVDCARVNDEYVSRAEGAKIVSQQNPPRAVQDLYNLDFVVVNVLTAEQCVHSALAVVKLV